MPFSSSVPWVETWRALPLHLTTGMQLTAVMRTLLTCAPMPFVVAWLVLGWLGLGAAAADGRSADVGRRRAGRRAAQRQHGREQRRRRSGESAWGASARRDHEDPFVPR